MTKNKMTLNEFIEAFSKLKEMGWVKSERKGSTGVGHTLERLLNLPENNIASPDLGTIELKSHRVGSGSMITLFTFNRKVWQMKPLDAIRKYGSLDENGRLGMYYTMSKRINERGLYLHTESDTVSVRHKSGEIIAEWQIQTLVERFMQKLPSLILVSAKSNSSGDEVEMFKFEKAQLLTGVSAKNITTQIEQGNILLDLRLHDKITSARNHGTGFRVYEDTLPLLYQNRRDL